MSTHGMHFIFQQDIREVLDHFTRLLAVRFSFLAPDGRELQVGENKPHCRFCRLVRTSLGLAGQCGQCGRQRGQADAPQHVEPFARVRDEAKSLLFRY